ncbi:hypothetical protein LIA77_10564 [Sarocladium implicatum]|nr:hypothetical protein LIA77_10564 [Sarocladium implicatum]
MDLLLRRTCDPHTGQDGIASKDYRPFRERRRIAVGSLGKPNVLDILPPRLQLRPRTRKAAKHAERLGASWSNGLSKGRLKLKPVATKSISQPWQARSRLSSAQATRLREGLASEYERFWAVSTAAAHRKSRYLHQ